MVGHKTETQIKHGKVANLEEEGPPTSQLSDERIWLHQKCFECHLFQIVFPNAFLNKEYKCEVLCLV